MEITIVGSGNIAHALVAYLGNKQMNNTVHVLSSQKQEWEEVEANDGEGNVVKGRTGIITDDPSEIIPASDLILFTLPSFARKKVLKQIAPFVQENTIIGSFPGIAGFDEEVNQNIDIKNIAVFSSQRAPFIARVKERGKSVIAVKKDSVHIAVSKNHKQIKNMLEDILDMHINLLDSFNEVNLSNSNPILHTARLYAILQTKSIYDDKILFYEEWDNFASEILLKMDEEFMSIVHTLKLKNVKSLKEHYGIHNNISMTHKIRSIAAFKDIYAPMIKLDSGQYILDIHSRYFTEDVAVGLKYIKDTANNKGVNTPMINEVFSFLTDYANKQNRIIA